MKKSFTLFLVLICLAVGGLAGMAVWVSKDEEAVEVTQTTLLGDPAAAQGLTITANNQLDNHLFWGTQFPAQDAGQAQTQFRFSLQKQQYERNYVDTPELMIPSTSGGMGTSGEFSPEELSDWRSGMFITPAADLAKDMVPNQTKTETVLLADYCDTLPIGMEDYYYRYRSGEAYFEMMKRQQQVLQDFFAIPAPEKFQITYTLTTGSEGGVNDIQVQSDQWINLNTATAQGEGGWYFTLDSYVSQEDAREGGISLDLSHIRDGYGVYFIPSLAQKDDERENLDVEKIQTVYVVPQGERTVNLDADEKGNLLLYTVAGETWYLNVLSGDGQQLLQRLELGQLGSNAYMADPLEGEDYLLLFFHNDQLCLLTWDGDYVLKYVLQMPENESWDIVGKEQLAQWDGQRLALLERDNSSWEEVRCRLTVWQAGELTYQGEYDFSFTKDNAGQQSSNYLIGSTQTNSMELRQ